MMREEPRGRTNRRTYLLLGGAVILGLLLGLGLGALVADEAGAPSTVDAAIQQTVDSWYEAWNQADGQTVVAMMAPGAPALLPWHRIGRCQRG